MPKVSDFLGSWARYRAISGYVADQSGAAVPGASVSVTNAKTGVQTKGITDSAGLYNITHLDPGEYSVAVEAAGFKRLVQEHVILQVHSTVRIDPKLELIATCRIIADYSGGPDRYGAVAVS